jgi:hypothetical protein
MDEYARLESVSTNSSNQLGYRGAQRPNSTYVLSRSLRGAENEKQKGTPPPSQVPASTATARLYTTGCTGTSFSGTGGTSASFVSFTTDVQA